MNKVIFTQTYKTRGASQIIIGKVKCNGETFDIDMVQGGGFFNILFKTKDEKSYAIKWDCTYVDAMDFLINGNIQGLEFKAMRVPYLECRNSPRNHFVFQSEWRAKQ